MDGQPLQSLREQAPNGRLVSGSVTTSLVGIAPHSSLLLLLAAVLCSDGSCLCVLASRRFGRRMGPRLPELVGFTGSCFLCALGKNLLLGLSVLEPRPGGGPPSADGCDMTWGNAGLAVREFLPMVPAAKHGMPACCSGRKAGMARGRAARPVRLHVVRGHDRLARRPHFGYPALAQHAPNSAGPESRGKRAPAAVRWLDPSRNSVNCSARRCAEHQSDCITTCAVYVRSVIMERR